MLYRIQLHLICFLLCLFSSNSRAIETTLQPPSVIREKVEYNEIVNKKGYDQLYIDQNYIYISFNNEKLFIFNHKYESLHTYSLLGFNFKSAVSLDKKIYLSLEGHASQGKEFWMKTNYIFSCDLMCITVDSGKFGVTYFLVDRNKVYIAKYNWVDRRCGEICRGPSSSYLAIFSDGRERIVMPQSILGIWDININRDGEVFFYAVSTKELSSNSSNISGVYQYNAMNHKENLIFNPFTPGSSLYFDCRKFLYTSKIFVCSDYYIDIKYNYILYSIKLYSVDGKRLLREFDSMSNVIDTESGLTFVDASGEFVKISMGDRL